MADKLAGVYSYIKKDGDNLSRVLLQPGDDVPKDLDKDERKQLKKDGIIVDEKRLSADNLRLPYGHPDSDDEESEVARSVAGGTAVEAGTAGGPGAANTHDGTTDGGEPVKEAKGSKSKD